jgi:hypothetical protein
MAINIFVEHFLEFTAQGYMHVYQELCVWHEHIIWNRLSTFLSWYRIYHVIRQIGVGTIDGRVHGITGDGDNTDKWEKRNFIPCYTNEKNSIPCHN